MAPPAGLSLGALFLRFLRFGAFAWGGPVAQIAMVREELVEDERWISRERFDRVLAVYQILPGPEAHELCVYFGHLAHGRIGGLVAGLGFMLPGFALMLVLSWAYVRMGIGSIAPAGLFYGLQAAVVALIVRAAARIGGHALRDIWLWVIALAAVAADLAGVTPPIVLGLSGLLYAVRHNRLAAMSVLVAVAGTLTWALLSHATGPVAGTVTPNVVGAGPTVVGLFGSGLLAGSLSFGGAYTAIPLLRRHAVTGGGWMTDGQFVDGLALSGILPAPLVIFGTFVGYLGGGLAGALAMTAGIFLPAFALTLVGHAALERLVDTPGLHAFLDGVMAGVVGLIAATTIRLVPTAVPDVPAGLIAAAALVALWRWRSKAALPVTLVTAGTLGMLVSRLG